MIRRLSIKNFGCLHDTTVDLAPFTVLVGPNDSGKSMILRALQAVATSYAAQDGWLAVFPTSAEIRELSFNQRGGIIGLVIEGDRGSDPLRYEISLRGDGGVRIEEEALTIAGNKVTRKDDLLLVEHFSRVTPRLGPLGQFLHRSTMDILRSEANTGDVFDFSRRHIAPAADALGSMRRHMLRAERLLDAAPLPESHRRPLEPEGLDLAAACADLLLANTGDFERIEHQMREAIPRLDRIHLQRHGNGAAAKRETDDLYSMTIATTTGARIPAHLASDGVLLFLAYLVLLRWRRPPWVLMLEEPESGFHPGMMERVVRMLETAAQGDGDSSPTQIIVTTQSPDFLNYVKPECIRVVTRDTTGATRVAPFTNAPDLGHLLEYQGPGEIWVNLGEHYITGTTT